jgi:ABC-2 type transport system ATP-binding protein
VIAVEDLSKTFVKRRSLREGLLHPFGVAERVTALDGVSLGVQQGEIFGLLGPNGAGKTTLLKILSCLIMQDRGQATVAGFSTRSQEMRVKASIGFVTSDERSFYWRLSGRENLHFFARLYNLEPAGMRARCQSLLERLELSDKADHAFMSYSSGMKQRMAVARALLHDPPVLYMDEPTRSLDPVAARHLRELVSATLNRREGKTILLATHNLAEAEELCGRIAILHRAKVRRTGTLAEVRLSALARERYLIETSGVDGFAPYRFDGGVVEQDGQGRLRAELERGGAALSHLLGQLLARGARIVSCTRQEASLQEIFDLAVSE